ncbi:MAG TPA: phosphodiester glycosidase family protein [Pyrinomonadaceae bacterium]|nr:phosphodiester glycosidase family protein [Pyrinomonadaceae bacterium]
MMKKVPFSNLAAALRRPVLIVFCALCALCSESLGQDFRPVHDGVEYAEVIRTISGQPVRMNLLRLDLSKVRLDLAHAGNGVIGMEKTSSIATRTGAVAAINAGFFRLDKSKWAGEPVGAFVVDGKVLSEAYSNRIALSIRNRPKATIVSIDHVNIDGFLTLGKATFFEVGIDRERKPNDLLIYTPEFGPSTLTDDKGLEVVVADGKIKEIVDGKGDTTIPPNGYVVSVSGIKRDTVLKNAQVGGRPKIQFLSIAGPTGWKDASEDPSPLNGAEDIVGGVPQLVRNGKVSVTWELEKTSRSFVDTRHPRTAVAKLKDGKFLMVAVDGRSESSGGIGLFDLAAYLIELGAVDAMNLDGGGSTTMYLDGKVVNHPSDKEGERSVSDAIIVTLRKSEKK